MAHRTVNARIFSSLQGTWEIRRQLVSNLAGFPSGTLEGTARFVYRKPSAQSVAMELLYHEEGGLVTHNGYRLRADRKYIYRYSADEDKISAWFVKEGTKDQQGKEEVDYLFHDVEIADGKEGMAGRGEHLCVKDMYWAYYEFRSPHFAHADDGEQDDEKLMNVFGIRFKVKGPEKDYATDASYQRSHVAELPMR